MQYYRGILNDMIRAFRSLSPNRIEYLLSVIRSTDSLEEIAIALEVNMAELRGEGQLGAQTLRELRAATAGFDHLGDLNPGKRRIVMSIQSLSDEPLFDVPAKPWTEVTDDDHFVSHLVSLYFTWEHAACHLVDRELFLEDMKKGQLDSHYCSPLLVNALLATACVGAPSTLICVVNLHIAVFFRLSRSLRYARETRNQRRSILRRSETIVGGPKRCKQPCQLWSIMHTGNIVRKIPPVPPLVSI